jgi:hypothetical protein
VIHNGDRRIDPATTFWEGRAPRSVQHVLARWDVLNDRLELIKIELRFRSGRRIQPQPLEDPGDTKVTRHVAKFTCADRDCEGLGANCEQEQEQTDGWLEHGVLPGGVMTASPEPCDAT